MIPPGFLARRRCKFAGNAAGLTLLEVTLTISIILVLIGILFSGSRIYASYAKRTSCVMFQDQIHKALVSDANLRGESFKPGVDYIAVAVISGVLEFPVACPDSGGSYTAIYDESDGELKVTCTDHGDDHRHR
jgi:hypothetical protein